MIESRFAHVRGASKRRGMGAHEPGEVQPQAKDREPERPPAVSCNACRRTPVRRYRDKIAPPRTKCRRRARNPPASTPPKARSLRKRAILDRRRIVEPGQRGPALSPRARRRHPAFPAPGPCAYLPLRIRQHLRCRMPGICADGCSRLPPCRQRRDLHAPKARACRPPR